MEYEKYSVSFKDAHKDLRERIIRGASCGGYSQRVRLLAFALIRGRSYDSVERTTEAKNYEDSGKRTYYMWLATDVSIEITKTFKGSDHRELYDEVMQWMKGHWKPQEEVS